MYVFFTCHINNCQFFSADYGISSSVVIHYLLVDYMKIFFLDVSMKCI